MRAVAAKLEAALSKDYDKIQMLLSEMRTLTETIKNEMGYLKEADQTPLRKMVTEARTIVHLHNVSPPQQSSIIYR